jgi:8-oxo-dGTP diphosphatase
MAPTEPDGEGCWSAGVGWYGQPEDTAHLRLSPIGEITAWGFKVRAENRLTGEEIAHFEISLDQAAHEAELRAFFAPSAGQREFAAEGLRRCLRMLFVNFGAALVKAENPVPDQGFDAVFAALGFAADGTLNATKWAEIRASRKHVLVVAAALIDADGRVLLARRPAGKAMAGQWEFPGGKIDPGETPEQALIRELTEELGIEVTNSCLAPLAFASHDYDHFHLLMPLYAIRQWRGRPEAREGQTLAWVSKDRLNDYPMPPADLPLVAQLRDWL